MSAKWPAWAYTGQPPTWAVEWGEDEHGVFVAFAVGDVVQRRPRAVGVPVRGPPGPPRPAAERSEAPRRVA